MVGFCICFEGKADGAAGLGGASDVAVRKRKRARLPGIRAELRKDGAYRDGEDGGGRPRVEGATPGS